MAKSRRQFLTEGSVSLLGLVATSCKQEQKSAVPAPHEAPPGEPPAFATSPPVGPVVSPLTFAEAEKLCRPARYHYTLHARQTFAAMNHPPDGAARPPVLEE